MNIQEDKTRNRIYLCAISYLLFTFIFATIFYCNCNSFRNLERYFDAFVLSITTITIADSGFITPLDKLGHNLIVIESLLGMVLFAFTINFVWHFITERENKRIKSILESEYEARINERLEKHAKIVIQRMKKFEYILFISTTDEDKVLVPIDLDKNVKRFSMPEEMDRYLETPIIPQDLINLFNSLDFKSLYNSKRIHLVKYFEELESFRNTISEFLAFQSFEKNQTLALLCYEFIECSERNSDIDNVLDSVSEKNAAVDTYVRLSKENIANNVWNNKEYRALYLHFDSIKKSIVVLKKELFEQLKTKTGANIG